MMLATVVHWTVVFILATRMRLTSECAATSPANTPQGEPPRPTDAQTAAAQTTPSTRPSCGRCQHIPVRMTDNNSRPVQQTDGQGPDGCPIITVNCDGNASDTAVILTWFDAVGMDVGSTFGSGNVQAVLRCDPMNRLLLQSGTVNEVECIAAQ